MAHIGNHILPIMVDSDMSILVQSQKGLTSHSFLYRVTVEVWLGWTMDIIGIVYVGF